MHHATLPFLLLLAGCASNYDFSKARLPNGEPDVPKMIADLKASGQKELSTFTWIPLVYLHFEHFKPSKIHYPAGYTHQRANCIGPVFAGGSGERKVVDERGAAIEATDWLWFGWGLLYLGEDERIETPSGPRSEIDHRVLLLLGRHDDVYYARKGS